MNSLSNKKVAFYLAVSLTVFSTSLKAQTNSITIGGTDINAKAVLWLKPAGGQGLLLPSLDTNTRTGMSLQSTDAGMIVFDNQLNKVFLFDGANWVDVGNGSGGSTTLTLTGDVTGTTAAAVVTGLQGNKIASTAPADQQVLRWNGAALQWQPATLAASATSVGDAQITSVSPAKLLQDGAATNDVLQWNGSVWAPAAISGSTYTAGSGLILTGNSFSVNTGTAAGQVVALAANGKLPAVDGSQLTNLPTGGAGVDTVNVGSGLTGGGHSSTVTVGLVTGISAGQILKWNGTSWALAADDIGSGSVPILTPGNLLIGDGTTNSQSSVTGDVTFSAPANIQIVAGAVTTNEIAGGTIVDSNISPSAGISVSKITAGITGQVLVSSGGTPAWATPAASFANPMNSVGDLIVGGTSGTATRLGIGAVGQVLSSDGTTASWQNASGTGTVTSVATGTGLSGGPITGSGTIVLANTAVAPATYGDATHVAQVAIDAQGRITSASNVAVTAGLTNPMTTTGDMIYGVGGAPTRLAGAAGLLKSTGAAAPAWSKAVLTTDVTGVLPIANGGTNGATATAALTNLGIATTASYIMKGNGTGLVASLAYDNGTSVGIGTTTPAGTNSVEIQTAVNGLFAQTSGSSNYGVYGYNSNTSGAQPIGVYGEADGINGIGVKAVGTNGTGLSASSSGGTGIIAISNTGNGISTSSTNGYGIYATSSTTDAGHFAGSVAVTNHLDVINGISASGGVTISTGTFSGDGSGLTNILGGAIQSGTIGGSTLFNVTTSGVSVIKAVTSGNGTSGVFGQSSGTGLGVYGYNNGGTGAGVYAQGTQAICANGAAGGTGGWGACSDVRFKKNITPLAGSLDKILRLKGVTYEFRINEFPDRNFEKTTQIGMIAQEVLDILPEVVTKQTDGYYSMLYDRLTPVLVEAVKEQQKMIDRLGNEKSDLKDQVAMLQSEVIALKESQNSEMASLKKQMDEIKRMLGLEAKKN